MSRTSNPWPVTGYLDALRPPAGWETELALLAAYSADSISIVAALLALIGRDDEDRQASRRDLADAIEALRGKARVIVQRGRLAKMAKTPRLTGVLDQFVREVPFDESRQSWHPKAALVRMSSGKSVEWRLWIGSRNLTAPENRDLGLVLVSGPQVKGRLLPGVDDIARSLAERAGLGGFSSSRLAAEVAGLKWRAPSGVRVDRLRISQGQSEWSLPTLPDAVDALTVVSPFLDAGFLRHLSKTRCRKGERQLLSTRFELERLAATANRFGDVLALDAPDYPASSPEPAAEASAAASNHEGEDVGPGLHAKLLHFRQGEQRRIWMGSANATTRAWSGRNVEILAELTVDESVEQGLLALLAQGRPVRLEADEALQDTERAIDRLERARAEVSARWKGEIVWDADGLRLRHPGEPHPSDPSIRLEAGLVTSDFWHWPEKHSELNLGPVEEADRTELVQLRLTLDGETCEWMVQAPASPPFGVERDRAAFMRSMGAREFLLWIADTIRGEGTGADEPDWTEEAAAPGRFSSSHSPWIDDLPTQEEILGAWTRAPSLYDVIGNRIRTYLPALLEHAATHDAEGHAQLQAFARLWDTLDAGLGRAP